MLDLLGVETRMAFDTLAAGNLPMDHHDEVRLERMRPAQLAAASDRFAAAYVPLGATEFHGRHLPVGLDGLKARGLLMRVARRIGGVVLPTVYHGTGGGHERFDWTWMVAPEVLSDTLLATLHGLDRSGLRLIVLLSGHLPNEDVCGALIERFKQQGGRAEVVMLSDADAFGHDEPRRIDHAGKWEASYMLALLGDTVDMSLIQSDSPIPAPDVDAPPGQWWFIEDADHPWYGIAGMGSSRPTDASRELGEACVAQAVDWVCEQVKERIDKIACGA